MCICKAAMAQIFQLYYERVLSLPLNVFPCRAGKIILLKTLVCNVYVGAQIM